ncbi:MAG: diaminopimelate decarboxylase, partial [Methanoregulaceae archaeon]|nr:diaminopimelate decarboxylase [Methanoregulaceae archaeon]
MNLPQNLTIRNDHLWIGQHDTVELARTYGTPVYVTDEDRITWNYEQYVKALTALYPRTRILYAAKANGNLAVLRLLSRLGAGADVFSSGELQLALAAGMAPEGLLFNGSSKSHGDLSLA